MMSKKRCVLYPHSLKMPKLMKALLDDLRKLWSVVGCSLGNSSYGYRQASEGLRKEATTTVNDVVSQVSILEPPDPPGWTRVWLASRSVTTFRCLDFDTYTGCGSRCLSYLALPIFSVGFFWSCSLFHNPEMGKVLAQVL